MIPHTCESCGHVFGENNAFVRQSRCCPRCGQTVKMKQGQGQASRRIALMAIIGLIVAVVFFFTHQLWQL